MEISRRLNLVQPIETETGTIYIHSTPISTDVWRNYFLALTKTYSELFTQGIHTVAGPAVATLMLETVSRAEGGWDGDAGVKRGLLPEIRRLTNVVMQTSAGWQTLPYEEALNRKLISPETAEEAEGTIVFFICASAVLRGPRAMKKLTVLLGMMESMWDAQTTPLSCMEFSASLPTSTPPESSGEKTPAASRPY